MQGKRSAWLLKGYCPLWLPTALSFHGPLDATIGRAKLLSLGPGPRFAALHNGTACFVAGRFRLYRDHRRGVGAPPAAAAAAIVHRRSLETISPFLQVRDS